MTQRCAPHFSSQSFSTDGCEGYLFDSLGRTTTITRADNSQVTIAYTGSAVKTTDERNTTSTTASSDGLGRLQTVTDDAAYVTSYSYDAFDDLTGVTQGMQTRGFTYDGLKRLLTVTQPETSQIQYSYDNNGNLLQKIQAGVLYPQINVNYTYDALNRLTGKTYSDATPPVSLCYDGRKFSVSSCNSITPVAGQKLRQTGVGDASSGALVASSDLTYDALGRIMQNIETIAGGPSSPYTMHYVYNPNDSQASVQYASGRTVTNCYDYLGRTIWASAVKQQSDCLSAQGTAPSSGSGYYGVVTGFFPPGQTKTMALGNGLTETSGFNNRQQTTSIQLATANAICPGSGLNVLGLGYTFPSGLNNGNVQTQAITSVTTGCQASSLTQTYSYDSLNRLTLVAETGGNNAWQEGYTYDQYGNIMTVPAQTNVQAPAFMPSASTQIDTSHNRVVKSTAAQATNDVQYDDAGNVRVFPVMSEQMTYDAENRLTSFQTSSGGTATYVYDGQGRRVMKNAAAAATYYVYGAGGELLAEYGGPSNTGANGTVYQTEDSLGSTRAVTDANGNIVSRSDYLPFGETIAGTATFNRNQFLGYKPPEGTSLTFTGKERDSETGLDYFGARYFSSAQGRWTSPDWSAKPVPIPYADLKDPQTLNLYAYVRNNPLSKADSDGHCSAPSLKGGQVGICIDTYIQAKTLPVALPLGGLAFGDGRGPAANDKDAGYRQEIQLVMTPGDKPQLVKSDGGTSIAEAAGIVLYGKGSSNTTVSDPKTDDNGTEHFNVSSTGLNGLSWVPLSPQDTIKTSLNFSVTADGKVGMDPGGMRTAYPSIEVYAYGADGSVRTLLQVKESGNLNDLKRQDQPIPAKGNQ